MTDERIDRLPKWAQTRIRNAEASLATTRAELVQAVGGTGEDPDTAAVAIMDHVNGHTTLPWNTHVRFRHGDDREAWVEVSLDEGFDGAPCVTVRGGREVQIVPTSSNAVYVRTSTWDEHVQGVRA